MISRVIRANAAHDRLPELLRLRADLEEVLVLLRLAKVVKAFKSFQSREGSPTGAVAIA